MHFTYGGDHVVIEGREFRFSEELGRRLGVSADGFIVTTNLMHAHHGNPRGPMGYFGTTVSESAGGHTVYDHRLVYELFVGQVPEGMQIDHINTDRFDNRVENLRAVTPSGNMRNPITRKRQLRQLGRVRHLAAQSRRRAVIVTWHGDDEPMEQWFEDVTKASEFTGVDRSSIAKMCTGRRGDVHGHGFTFQYCDEEEF